MKQDKNLFVESLRLASPYLIDHKKKNFLLLIEGDETLFEPNLKLIEDIILLQRIGIRLILIPCLIPDEKLSLSSPIDHLQKEQLKALEHRLWEKTKSAWVQCNAQFTLIRNELLRARPMGTIDGSNMLFASEIDSVPSERIKALLKEHWVIWQSPFGLSNLGSEYVLSSRQIAVEMIKKLPCEKLIYLSNKPKETRQETNHLSCFEAKKIPSPSTSIRLAIAACQAGVKRVHLLNSFNSNSLLFELFSSSGSGVLVHNDGYDSLTVADETCALDIVHLLSRLEYSGRLVKRNKKEIEQHIQHFHVVRIEERVIACISLQPLEPIKGKRSAEVACLAVHPQYQSLGLAKRLLHAVIEKAKAEQFSRLFVLTTRAESWFEKHGFRQSNYESLPTEKRLEYDHQRQSTVLHLDL